MAGEWVVVEPSEVDEQRKKARHRHLKVRFFPSPYDIPDGVRGRYDREKERFLIEFRYLGGDEKWRVESKPGAPVWLRIGKHSGRLYGIELDLTKVRVDGIELEIAIEQAVEAAVGDHARGSSANKTNSAMVSKTLQVHKNAVLAGLPV